jgi:hypothetical protein
VADVIAYIDGFNLYHGLRDRYGRRYLWLDLVELVGRLRPRDSVLAVRYFTAVVRNDPPAQARQQAYLDALQTHCGGLLQIVYAVSLVADAAASSADLALLISADSDLCPAIRTARIVAAGRQARFGIIAAFPPRRYSHEVKKLIPGAFTLSHQDIRNSLLPGTVIEATSGRKFSRPREWQ